MRYYIQLVDLTAVEAESDNTALEVAASKIVERLQTGQARMAIVDCESSIFGQATLNAPGE